MVYMGVGMKILAIVAIIALWVAGGQWRGRIRDIPVPIILGVVLGFLVRNWMVFVAICAAYQTIRIGYGAYDPEHDDKPSFLASITHDRQGYIVRAIWGLLVATIGAAPLLFVHYPVWKYGIYVGANILINFSVCKFRLPVYATDILVSAGVGSVVFLV
jgi:hypothetical protein